MQPHSTEMANPADLENGAHGQPAAPVKPAKVVRPPSPTLPRLFAGLAILCLLAIPIVVPIVYMKVTHSTGKRGVPLSDAIIAPRDIEAIPSEEVTPQEVKESFLKVSNATVRPAYASVNLILCPKLADFCAALKAPILVAFGNTQRACCLTTWVASSEQWL